MNKLICFTAYLLITIVPVAKAQEATAPNGHYIKANGLTLYYEETGKGMPLLLLHGFGRTASDWRSYTTELAKSYRVIAVDMPGHGRSGYMDTTNIYLHKRAAEYILAMLDSLHIDSINVLGHSSGGFITLYMATLKPMLLKNIIVVSAQVYYSNTTRQVITSLGEPDKNQILRLDSLKKLHGPLKGKLIADQFWNFRKLYGDPSFTPDVLSTITAKTFIIHGDDDPIAPLTNAWEMYQHIPLTNLWVIPKGGHIPHIGNERKEDFIKAVLAFLQNE